MSCQKLSQTECQELIQVKNVQIAYTTPGDNTLLNRILNCIYELYAEKITNGVIYECGGGMDKYTCEDIIEEAFQNGIIAFHEYAKEKSIQPNATLETIIKAFCKWQFLCLKQQKFREQKRLKFYSEQDLLKKEESKASMIEEMVEIDEKSFGNVIKLLLSENEYILYQGIEKLDSKKWRKVMRLRYFFGEEITDIAKEMHVSKDDIYNTIAKSKKELKKITGKSF